MSDQRDWPECCTTPAHLKHDVLEIVAMAMAGSREGCCGLRGQDGRCCLTDSASLLLAALESHGISQDALQALIEHKAGSTGT